MDAPWGLHNCSWPHDQGDATPMSGKNIFEIFGSKRSMDLVCCFVDVGPTKFAQIMFLV